MRAFGGMLSLEIEGGRDEAVAFCSSLQVFSLADSLNGVESLCHPASMTHASIPKELREPRGVTTD
jgi:cystathionine beta-lyase/cystathionine gamma-synthase